MKNAPTPTLFTPRAAAEILSERLGTPLSEPTAYRRILAASKRGDSQIQRVAGAWVAPEAWWVEEFTRRPVRRRGRPRRAPPSTTSESEAPAP